MPVVGIVRGSVSPTTQNLSWNRANIPPAVTTLIVKGINADYASYYINFENTNVEWLSQSSGFLDISGGSDSLQLELQNLEQLFGSNYKATVYITLTGPEGADVLVTSVINLSISGTSADAIVTDKSNYNLIYNRVTNTLSGDTVVNILNNTSNVNLSFETIGTLLKEKTFSDSFTLEEDSLFPFATNSELPQYGTAVVNCRLKREGVNIYPFNVTIAVIGDKEVITDPDDLEFTLRKSFNETQNQILEIINPLNKAITITGPDWLVLSSNSTSSNLQLTVTTVNSGTMNAGFYSGKVLINYDSTIIEVPVSLSVIEFLHFEEKDYYFCLEKVPMKFERMVDTARFVQIIAKMIFYTQSGTETIEAIYSAPYFKNIAEIDLGEKVQSYFPIFQNHLLEKTAEFDNVLIYKPAELSMTINEIDIDYNVLHSVVKSGLKFFAGSKPKLFPLFTNHDIRRRYSGTSHIYSYFTGILSPEDFTGKAIVSNPVTNNEVTAVLLTEKNSDFDKIAEKSKLEFLNFPDTERKILMQWLNNNLVPECFVFSGDYKITDEFEHIYDNVTIDGRKYDSTELSKLTIFTGFILKEEKELLKEMNNSLLSWIKIENKIYKCISITQKIIEKDSTEDLITFELEFLIVK